MMMRVAMLAAAAALVAAVPAEAARYYEFELTGSTIATFMNSMTPEARTFRIDSSVTVSFDSLGNPVASGTGLGFSVQFSGNNLRTLNMPGGTYFNLSFDPTTIGSTFQPVSATGPFGYIVCSTSCGSPTLGTLTSFNARTSDTAPSFLGLRGTETLTAVPEPATWAMMIVGVGVIGGTARRRRPIAVAVAA